MANARAQNIIVPMEVRGSFVHLFEREKKQNGDPGNFSMLLLFPKQSNSWMQDLPWLWANIAECLGAQFPGGQGAPPWCSQYGQGKPWPVSDGDVPNSMGNIQEAHKGHWVVRVSSGNFDVNTNLIKLGPDGKAIPVTQNECFSGCYFKVELNAYFYKKEGSIGVGLGMNNVLLVREGEPLGGGGTNAATAFGVEPAVQGAAASFQPGAALPGAPVQQLAQVPSAPAPGAGGVAPAAGPADWLK